MASQLVRTALMAFCAGALAWSASGAAHAAEPTDADKRQAGAYFSEGDRLFQQGLYAAAIENFQKAHEIIPHEVNLYNIARAYEQLNDPRGCIDGYQAYVAFFKAKHGNDPDDVSDVRRRIKGCKLALKPEVTIGSDPEGAKVFVNDHAALLGQTPFKTTLDPGTYKLFLDLEGHAPFSVDFEVRAGEPLKLFFKLEKLERVGRVSVRSNIRNAQIFIDGRNIGLTPYDEAITLTEGQHQVTVRKEDYLPWNKELTVEAKRDYTVVTELFLRDPPMTWKGYLGWASLVLGAGGVTFGYIASTQADTYFQGTDDFEQWEMLQHVGYGAGGGLMGVGALLLIFEALDTEAVRSEDAIDAAAAGGLTVLPIASFGADGRSGLLGADVRF
ncbi:MAG: hypothetical protein CSA66_06410 [Proteobacteria bacterium]|nr:MAG: hypothetical protein CSA66_06410 [Pseudomonadota bacterium]